MKTYDIYLSFKPLTKCQILEWLEISPCGFLIKSSGTLFYIIFSRSVLEFKFRLDNIHGTECPRVENGGAKVISHR